MAKASSDERQRRQSRAEEQSGDCGCIYRVFWLYVCWVRFPCCSMLYVWYMVVLVLVMALPPVLLRLHPLVLALPHVFAAKRKELLPPAFRPPFAHPFGGSSFCGQTAVVGRRLERSSSLAVPIFAYSGQDLPQQQTDAAAAAAVVVVTHTHTLTRSESGFPSYNKNR